MRNTDGISTRISIMRMYSPDSLKVTIFLISLGLLRVRMSFPMRFLQELQQGKMHSRY